MYLIQLVSVLAALALSCPLVEAEPVARQNAARSKNGVEVRQGRQRSGWPIGTVANIPVKRDVDHAERSRKRECEPLYPDVQSELIVAHSTAAAT
jgi:hypothetical protein